MKVGKYLIITAYINCIKARSSVALDIDITHVCALMHRYVDTNFTIACLSPFTTKIERMRLFIHPIRKAGSLLIAAK